MNVLVFNAGSSSLKFKLIRMPEEREVLRGIVERVGETRGRARVFCAGPAGQVQEHVQACSGHSEALAQAIEAIDRAFQASTGRAAAIDLLGHRVVHGRDIFTGPTRVDDQAMEQLASIQELAPLHLPPALDVLRACRQRMPALPQVACFDTTFYCSMPAKSYLYAVPREWHTRYGVRRFGFHGLSHQYVTQAAADLLGIPIGELKLISAHLGNGASITAFSRGRVVDTSMGFTPLEGLIMGTRAGYLDPAVLPYLQRHTGLDLAQLVELLNNESGLKAIGGCGRDLRTIMAARAEGNPDAALAVEMYVHTLRKYIGAYHFALSGAQALVFTGGIGENARDVRSLVLADLEALGLVLDPVANHHTVDGRCGFISAPHSKVKVLVVPTDEERMIARQAFQLIVGPAG
ncbi:MAG TPA: acetate kinase [Desulfobacteraceae bacterium]|nr:acetate kinase [Deltaproteobacteria bacterium]HDI61213.1 acetate kinase [Desulfobacteraceae bacterium]